MAKKTQLKMIDNNQSEPDFAPEDFKSLEDITIKVQEDSLVPVFNASPLTTPIVPPKTIAKTEKGKKAACCIIF